ncbi:hypothetical protein NX02_22245 [Sphingomonas sanxanigenens DSM 19645 = NX02]|uniref:Uncharacterized protein n=1 Tax=Sphingomonas sanxanigenens DSM 19645 = NX02 TaxID=1123269 RepID=W0AHR8_9SPHN|nr:hypothetical protein NX02_22245 [Sphingomonas sanxanigenens DSM 19645 = NX02]
MRQSALEAVGQKLGSSFDGVGFPKARCHGLFLAVSIRKAIDRLIDLMA